jgi:hypothetical protein
MNDEHMQEECAGAHCLKMCYVERGGLLPKRAVIPVP